MEKLSSYLSKGKLARIIILLSFLFCVGAKMIINETQPDASSPGFKVSSKSYIFHEVCSDSSGLHSTTHPSHSFSHSYPCSPIMPLIMCFLVLRSNYPRFDSISSSAGAHSRTTHCWIYLTHSRLSFPRRLQQFLPSYTLFLPRHWHSSYKKAHLCSLLLNLSKAMTTAETRPCDFWGQDRKDNSAATQFSQKALF